MSVFDSAFDWFAALPAEDQLLYIGVTCLVVLGGFLATIFLPAVREGEGFGEPTPPSAPVASEPVPAAPRSPFAGKRVSK
ncbi:hypothetical protein Rhe02_54210 [Rhizocola hellebori]|uniref:Uncharacterized protein n=1 Tax=Rhizocola hellebori TaxID=1392758 RepID=A0A8J3QCL5_9ACTN|nr:hypothetical protein [Rhizocola hellebori]GIH07354.1 hypothetical protein Rhe02_54210 [Rhizocola hellebori]